MGKWSSHFITHPSAIQKPLTAPPTRNEWKWKVFCYFFKMNRLLALTRVSVSTFSQNKYFWINKITLHQTADVERFTQKVTVPGWRTNIELLALHLCQRTTLSSNLIQNKNSRLEICFNSALKNRIPSNQEGDWVQGCIGVRLSGQEKDLV